MSALRQPWRLRLLVVGVLAAMIALLAAAPARAADTRGGENILIARGEVVEGDLYAAGKTVTVDGTIDGDLVAIGGQVTINGAVNGDVLAAAQSVLVNGVVSDDVRVAGQAIQLGPSARVGGDLATAAFSLEHQAGSMVAGDLLVGAYQALLAGTIGRNLTGALERMELRGVIQGDANLTIGGQENASALVFSPAGSTAIPAVPPRLTVASSARVGGKLVYRAPSAADVSPAAQIAGGVTFDRQATTPASAPQPVVPGLDYLRRLAALLLAGLLLLWLAPAWTRRLADTVEAQPLPSLGWGVVGVIAFGAAVVAALIATILLAVLFGFLTLGGLVGLTLGAGMLASAALVLSYIVFAAYVAEGIVGYMVGRWLLRRVQPAWAERPIIALALGVGLYVALRAIPVLGVVVAIAVVLLGLGALWIWGRATLIRARPAPPAPVAGMQPA